MPPNSLPGNHQELRSVDRELLVAMRRSDSVGIGDLTKSLGVTATAVRQRVDRLLEMGLIDREKLVAGRGRPTYRYRLTVSGYRRAGANPTDIAEAMWREILELENPAAREQVLSGIAKRLGQQYAAQLGLPNAGSLPADHSSEESEESFESRMQRFSGMLADRQVVTEVNHCGELPVLDIGVCPYPSLIDASDDRSMCRLEEQMFSEALGQRVQLSSCRLDGDSCCQFSPVEATTES